MTLSKRLLRRGFGWILGRRLRLNRLDPAPGPRIPRARGQGRRPRERLQPGPGPRIFVSFAIDAAGYRHL
jgi:hypothetical protein